ncbi:MAG TPA: hypothetical protein VGG72_10800 [Bryobacteraceae bacterium]|jgi:hypothetical protein
MSFDLEPAKLLGLHGLTRSVSQACLRHLKAHLEAMAPLFRPRRFLGDHMEGSGKEPVGSADRNLSELQELYARVAVKPFALRPELRTPLESVTTQFQFDEWEYAHATETDRGWQPIRVKTPLTWVISYGSSYSLATLRSVISGDGQRDPEAIRAFILRACLMNQLFAKIPALTDLLTGLRYKVEVRKSPQLGELPLVTVSAPFRTFRPQDKLVALASGFSGGDSFAEIIDTDSLWNLSDPLRDEALEIVKRHQAEI